LKEVNAEERHYPHAGSSTREYGRFIFAIALFAYLLTLNGLWATDHSTAFLEFDYAIWANHTFVLGTVPNFVPHSVDTFLRNGSYYMAAAPGAGILTLPFAALGFLTDGGQFSVFGWTMVLSEIPIALCNALAAYLVYRIARLYFDARLSALLAIVYAFSTISFPFATYLFQHDPSAMFAAAAAYVALRMARGESWGARYAIMCGLAVSAAFLTDYVNGVLGLVVLAYLVAVAQQKGRIPSRRNLKVLASFIVSCLAVGVFLYLAYNYVSFGSPLVSSEEAYKNTGSVLSGFNYPIQLGVVLNTVSPERGIFLFTPFLTIGVIGVAMMIRRLPKDGLFMLSMFLGTFLPYSMWRDVSGGLGFGPRFLISAMPFLIIPAGFALQKVSRERTRVAVLLLYLAGAVINTLAAFTSSIAPDKGWSVSPFVDSTLSLLSQGLVGSWWNQWWAVDRLSGLVIGSVAVVVVGYSAFVFPARLIRGMGRDEEHHMRISVERKPVANLGMLPPSDVPHDGTSPSSGGSADAFPGRESAAVTLTG
jgi:4-amino-4-deoxy-L-arabinose transferase-like glycosyltransferase